MRRSNWMAAGLLVLLTLALVLWNDQAERDCEERGGRVVWDVNMAASNAYGECVGTVP